jgi:hypothetical protein
MRKSMLESAGYATLVVLVFSVTCMVGMPAAVANPDYVWGEASAAEALDPAHVGYWKYCIAIGWDVSEYSDGAHGASHLSLALELEDCLADCGDVCFAVEDTVGVGGGVEACSVYFYAEIDIKGDPTTPADIPAVKFEPYPDACEPDVAGGAYVCFYSLMAPEAGDAPPATIWIKFGPYTEEGLVTGKLPSCTGTAEVGHSTWSSIKRLFR